MLKIIPPYLQKKGLQKLQRIKIKKNLLIQKSKNRFLHADEKRNFNLLYFVSDIKYKKIGNIFKKIEATYNGHKLATTKKELFQQLKALDLDEVRQEESITTYVLDKYLKQNIANIKNADTTTISAISKYIKLLEIDSNKNKLNEYKKLLVKSTNTLNKIKYYLLDHLIMDEKTKISSVLHKLKNDCGKEIKDFAIEKIVPNSINPINYNESLDIANSALDAYFCAKGNYSILDSDSHKYYKYLKEIVSKKRANTIKAKLAEPMIQQSNTSEFKVAQRLDGLREFLFKYSKSEPEISNYLYETLYLNEFVKDEKTIQILKEINSKFKTKLFITDNEALKNIEKIYKRLNIWKTTSNSKAHYPESIFITSINKLFLGSTGGFFHVDKNTIYIRIQDFSKKTFNNVFDHEMIHKNDSQLYERTESIGIGAKEYNLKKYKSELISAGVSKNQAKLALKDADEFIAYAGSNDSSKYSKELKSFLIKLGLPIYVFKLPRRFE